MMGKIGVANIFFDGGEMGLCMRSHNWLATPLGAVESWPQTLRTMVSVMLDAPHPMAIFWGQALTTLCNDGYRDALKAEDPLNLLAKPGPVVWAEFWGSDVRDILQATAMRAIATGTPSGLEHLRMLDWQGDGLELVEHPFSYSPIRAESGRIEGLLCVGSRSTVQASERDRTEALTKTAAALQTSQQRLSFALKTGKIGSWQLILSTLELITSERCKTNYGLSPDADFTHQVLMARIHPDDRDWVSAEIQQTIEQGTDYDVEYRTIWDDGSTHWAVARAYLSRDESDNPERLVGISIDTTQRKQAEEAVATSERRFRRVVESNMFGVLFGKTTGELSYANDYVLDMLGYSAEDLASGQMRWDEITSPEFADQDLQAAEQVSTQGICEPYEKVYLHKDGRRIPVLVAGAALHDSTDDTGEGVGFLLNLTELKQVTAERDRFFELSPDMFAIGRISDGQLADRFSYVNQAWEQTLGFTPAEITAQPFIDLVHPDDRAATIAVAQSMSSGIDLVGFENRYRCKDGSYKWLSWNVNTISEQHQFYAVARNITARKETAAELETLLAREQTAREAAERANRIKDEFLAVVSHELRSPLNPIVGWSQLLKRGLSPEKTKVALDTIERNAKLQVQLIGDLLDISKLLRGKLSLNEVPVDLSAVVPNALETVQQDAEAKSIRIEADLATCSVVGDAVRLQQVVWNLLTNAVKFTPEGGRVTVRLSAEANQSADAAEAVIQVVDTGKGIDGEFLPYVFEHFRQENYATTRQFGGLGLGLAIVRQIVEMHNGTVAVDSLGENQGATFTVRLPLIPTPNDPLPAVPATNEGDLSSFRILLVEDDPDSQEITLFALELASATVTAVASGAAALEAFDADVPDVLISDVGMPDMDGYELMSRVRQRTQAEGRDVLAIALTAYAGEGDEQRALDAGFQRYLTKPVDPDRLIRIVRSLLNAKNPCPKDKDS